MNTSKDFSNVIAWTNTQVRNNPFPLERYSIFDSISAANDYAKGVGDYAGKAYEGQIIAVTNNGEQEVYVLDSTLDDGLRKIPTGDLSGLSAEIQNLSTGLSAEIQNLSTGLSAEIQNLSVGLSAEIQNLSVGLSAEIQNLSTGLSAEIQNLSVGLSTEIDNLSAEVSARAMLSVDGIHTNEFRFQRISRDDYHNLVLSVGGETVDPNTLYVVSSDNLSMYDQRITNMANGISASDAATYGQVLTVKKQIHDAIANVVSCDIYEDNLSVHLSDVLKCLFDIRNSFNA